MIIDKHIEIVRDCLARFGKGRSTIRGDGLARRISKKTKLPIADIIPVLEILKSRNELICEDWFNDLPLGLVTLNLERKPDTPTSRLWRMAMAVANFTDKEIASLQGMTEILVDLCKSDLVRLATGLKQLKNHQNKLNNESRYPVSARYLLGSSKILDALPNAALKDFGVNIDELSKPTSYVITAGASNPEKVILVENPQALEIALKAKIPNISWIATYGYGLSMIGDDYGRQLASIIEDQGKCICPLVREGNPPSFGEMINHNNIYFWGDLDLEGLRIYSRLKSKLPALKLSGLYMPMVKYITESGLNHPYIKLTGKEGQTEWVSKDNNLSLLIEICRTRGLDQEILIPEEIERFANLEFHL